jgi:hypothetical protein
MKKNIIGAIVAGIILFICQFLSWTVLNLHKAQQTYTPKQDSILTYLGTQLSEDGAYFMPGFKPGTPRDEMEKQMPSMEGKPWAQVVYHKSLEGMNKMFRNMGRGLLVNIVIFWLFCWLLAKIPTASFGTIFMGSLGTGIIVFLNAPYTQHIWFGSFDLMAHFTDALCGWGLAGIWLGWWLPRKR